MNDVNENNFPIESLWFIRHFVSYFFGLIVIPVILYLPIPLTPFYLSYLKMGLIVLCLIPYHLINAYILAHTFHYNIGENFITVTQGIISTQKKDFSYTLIQNIFLKQNAWDKISGLASLIIENASQGSGQPPKTYKEKEIGFMGNMVIIPGLSISNAEGLKNIILQKMATNRAADQSSGL